MEMNGNSSSSSSEAARETVRRARHEAYRGLILEAAERAFGERGYADARVADIAEAAGVATGTVYAIFPGKRDLYRAIHRENLAELARRYAGIPSDGPVREVILRRSALSTAFLASRPHYLRMYLREAGRWGFDPGNVPDDAAAFMDRALYERGIAEGVLIDADPLLLQSLILAGSQVHLSHWLRGGMREEPEALAARIQAHTARVIFADPS